MNLSLLLKYQLTTPSYSFGKFDYIKNQLQNTAPELKAVQSYECMRIIREENRHGNNGRRNLFLTFVFTNHFYERHLLFPIQCSVFFPTSEPPTSRIRGFYQSITRIRKNYLNVHWTSTFTMKNFLKMKMNPVRLEKRPWLSNYLNSVAKETSIAYKRGLIVWRNYTQITDWSRNKLMRACQLNLQYTSNAT